MTSREDAEKNKDLIRTQAQTRQLFSRAVGCIKAGAGPADSHALDVISS